MNRQQIRYAGYSKQGSRLRLVRQSFPLKHLLSAVVIQHVCCCRMCLLVRCAGCALGDWLRLHSKKSPNNPQNYVYRKYQRNKQRNRYQNKTCHRTVVEQSENNQRTIREQQKTNMYARAVPAVLHTTSFTVGKLRQSFLVPQMLTCQALQYQLLCVCRKDSAFQCWVNMWVMRILHNRPKARSFARFVSNWH